MKLYAKSWLSLKNNLLYLPIPMLTDLTTILFILLFGGFYKAATLERYTALFSSAIKAQPADAELKVILYSTLLLFAAIYIAFTLLQSVSWYWSYKFCQNKVKFSKILKNYARYNLLWVFLFMIVTVIHKLALINDTFTGGLGPDNSTINGVASIFYFIVIYFALVSYLMLPLKIGLKKGNIIIPVLFLIWVTYLVLDYIALLAGSVSQILGIVVSMLILLPIFIWARVYLILAMKEVLK